MILLGLVATLNLILLRNLHFSREVEQIFLYVYIFVL
jgi:hypothetical protein